MQSALFQMENGAGGVLPWLRKIFALKQLQGGQAWAVAIVLGGLSIAVRFRFTAWLDQTPFLPFFPPVAAAALICGWRCAAFLLALSTAVAACFFFRPHGPGVFPDLAIILRLVGFVGVGSIFIFVIALMHGAIRRLQGAVQLQESLFRELQHRVANNMQVVAAMLAQTRRAMDDAEAKHLIERAEMRIRAMGELHRRLYDPRGYEGGLETLLRDTLGDLFQDQPVEVGLHVWPEPVATDQVTLIVLLVTEAATNAAKHVFRAGQGRRFDVSLAKLPGGRMRLMISDDGPGFERVAAPAKGVRRLGLDIMQSLAIQLGGALQVSGPPGTILKVEFQPLSLALRARPGALPLHQAGA